MLLLSKSNVINKETVSVASIQLTNIILVIQGV